MQRQQTPGDGLRCRPRRHGTWLLNRIDAREKALTSQIEQTRDQIEELTARLRELDQDLDHLRITRKTLLVLAAEPDPAPPPPPAPVVPITPPTSRFSPT
ncbi:hypothetical protein [Nonomuraea insulae]|uniref:Uncharacterized protein n=1 Tax=Nonomuraea insulae TaxID=1616787 RepID=A0ABW1CKU2_9ACTN